MVFEKAKTVLRDAAFRVGAELFTQEALLKINRDQADMGIETAKEELKMAEFVNEIFDRKSMDEEKYKDFWEFIYAIAVLDDFEKQTDEKNITT